MSEKQEATHSPKHLLLVATILVVVAVGIAGYFYYQYQQSQSLLQNPSLAAQIQTQQLVTMVGKLIQLPVNETPTIATVSDASKLKSQAFFQNAKNGDKVLIYTGAKEAILYRPSANKIIAVAPVNLGSQTTPAPSPVVSPTKVPTKTLTPRPTL